MEIEDVIINYYFQKISNEKYIKDKENINIFNAKIFFNFNNKEKTENLFIEVNNY